MKLEMLRAVQLDLARQMESPEMIRQFIDFLSESGYNALMLYLEDRIRTKFYPYPADNECYTPEQIRELVTYGTSKGIELFPCVPTLGHAERFLRFKELEPVSEMRGGIPGRFGGKKMNSFCVSTPETCDFLFAYMREVAELFPSKWFHIGLDEFWNFALCDLCKKAAPDFQHEEELFLNHIKKVSDFLVHELGKRPVMWTDMFELYHDILPEVPRSVVMADWQYQNDVRFLQAHFNNLTQSGLEEYERLGFDVLICPADRTFSNSCSYIQMAEKHPCCIGGLLTCWEKTDTYLWRSFPVMAAFAEMLQGVDADTAFANGMKRLFGSVLGTDETLKQTIRFLLDQGAGYLRHYSSSGMKIFYTRSTFGFPYARYDMVKLAHLVLDKAISENASRTLPVHAMKILRDLSMVAQEMILQLEFQYQSGNILDFGVTEQRTAALRKSCAAYKELYRQREAEWPLHRPGILPNFHTNALPEVFRRIDEISAVLSNPEQSYLRLRAAHCDWYGMPQITLSCRKEHDSGWRKIAVRNMQPPALDNTQEFEMFIPLDLPAAEMLLDPNAVLRIEYNGYGGVGIAYAAVVRNGAILRRPGTVAASHGTVSNRENILTDDSRFVMLGSQNMRMTYENKELFPVMHGLDLLMK